MIPTRMRDRTIALTAVVQAAKLVQTLAETGEINMTQAVPLLNSLVFDSAPDTESLYGDISQLKTGLVEMTSLLSKNKNPQEIAILRYVLGLLHLEYKLCKRPEVMVIINHEIEQLPGHIEYFGSITSPQILARLSSIYQRTLSEIPPRIQIYGDERYLQHTDNINMIRALLLAGIRAAVLWRQKGGRRWQFLFQSGKILEAVQSLQIEAS